jgi:hypothetical protein
MRHRHGTKEVECHPSLEKPALGRADSVRIIRVLYFQTIVHFGQDIVKIVVASLSLWQPSLDQKVGPNPGGSVAHLKRIQGLAVYIGTRQEIIDRHCTGIVDSMCLANVLVNRLGLK